jgi:hypothetical protein
MVSTEASSPPAEARDGRRALSRSPYRWSCALLIALAPLAHAWKVMAVPLPGVGLTVGRILILALALAVVVELVRGPRRAPRAGGTARAAGAVMAALLGWIALSAAAWGCGCSGELAGFAEVAAVAVLAFTVASLEPRVVVPLLVSVVAGALLAAALSLIGAGWGAAPADPGRRLAGPLGNPNYTAFALALAFPAAVTLVRLASGRARWAAGAAAVLVAGAALLTLSRGGAIALVAGILAAVIPDVARSGRRRNAVAVVAAVLVAGAAAYPLFAGERRAAELDEPSEHLRYVDVTGWDRAVRGTLIRSGPSTFRNAGPGVLEVLPAAPGQGASYRWGRAEGGRAYELTLEARAGSRTRVAFGLEDDQLGLGTETVTRVLDRAWRPISVRWVPTADARYARLYAWTPGAAAPFELRDVRVSDAAAARPIVVPLHLQGSQYERERARRARDERRRDLGSRRTAARLALEAFAPAPVAGMGWGDFLAYSDANAAFGRLATHDEYLRFLAELGLVGAGLLAGMMLLLVRAARQMPRGLAEAGVRGTLVAGAVGLIFLNGLVASQAALALALAAGVCLALGGSRR